MRKMNKIVALSLVLAMALSMMASAASFKDQATINEDLIDEINLLVNLGVYSEQGTGAGYFEPNGTITRSQAAKIIYVLKNKGVDNGAAAWTGLNIFSDVEAGAWYEGYVNYCASTGILAGTGDGKYTPNGQLTGVELAKMLLVVIGYKADVEGYTGNGWDANIIADAEAAGLFVDYELPVRGIVTREWAAQMIVNALNATKVKYEDGMAVEMYDSDNYPVTYMDQDLGLLTITGYLAENANIKLNATNVANGGDANCIVVDEDGDELIEFEYEVEDELIGSLVDVLVKYNGNKIYGVTANKDNIITVAAVDSLSFDADDLEGFEEDFVMYEDYKAVASDFDYEAFFGSDDPREIQLVDTNNDGDAEFGFIASVAYDKINYINPAKTTVRFTVNTGFNTTDEDVYADYVFVDSVEKGDIVKITKDYSTGEELINIELVDVVAGTVTKVTSGGVATIDGGSYELANTSLNIMNELNVANWVDGTSDLKVNSKAMNYYVDGKYVVYTDALSSDNEIPTNFAYLVEVGTGYDEDKFGNQGDEIPMVEVVLNDGTRAVYEYDVDINDDAEDVSAEDEGTIFEYVIEDGKICLIEVSLDYSVAADNEGFFDVSANKFINDETYRVNDDTFFFVIDEEDDKITVVAASEIDTDADVLGENVIVMEDGFKYVVTAAIEATTAVNNDLYVGASSWTTEIVDGEEVIYFDVTGLDGTVVTLKLDDATSMGQYRNKLLTYTLDSDGMATLTIRNWVYFGYEANGAVTYFDDTAAIINGEEIAIADDVEIYYVDAYVSSSRARLSVTEGDGLVLAAEIEDGVYEKNIRYGLNTDGEIDQIIIEVDGEDIWAASKLYGTNTTAETWTEEVAE